MGEFKMPALGADMEAGTLVEWLVKPGDRVERGQIVAVVETQKGAIDVEIYEGGAVEELLVKAGVEVPVGTVLATIRSDTDEAAPVGDVAAPAVTEREAAGVTSRPTAGPAQLEPETGAAAPTASRPDGRRVAPRARKLAVKLGVDLERVTGSGPGGSITGEDVERAAAGSAAPGPVAGMREAIAAAMSRSKREIPHYYLAHTVDVEDVLARLERDNASRPPSERVLPIAVLVRAVAVALADYPEMSGWYRDGAFVPAEVPRIGLAVSLRGGGLVAPALPDGRSLDLGGWMRAIADLVARARRGGLRASELSEPSITLTNLGEQGVDRVYGVIQPPQVAILGFGAIASRPWVVGDAVRVRRVVDVTLAADHRVSDGHRGARFLAHLARTLATMETG